MSNYYVRNASIGDNNGSDWYNAFVILQDAIDAAVAQTSGTHNIYIDTDQYSITSSFTVNSEEISIKGGYIVDEILATSGYTVLTKSDYNTFIDYDSVATPIIISSGILNIEDTCITNYNSTYLFRTDVDGLLYVSSSEILTYNFVYNSGYVNFDEVNTYGSGTYCINTYGEFDIYDSIISNYTYGVWIDEVNSYEIINSTLTNNNNNMVIYNVTTSGNMVIRDTLINSNNGIYVDSSLVHMTIDQSTINCDDAIIIASGSGVLSIDKSIINASNTVTNIGNIYTSATLSNFNTSYDDLDYNSGCVLGNPNFKDSDNGDFNLLAGTSDNTNYSPAIDLAGSTSSYDIHTDAAVQGFVFPGRAIIDYDIFLYQKSNNIIFSDYQREVMLAKLMNMYDQPISFEYNFKRTAKIYDTITRSAFSLNNNDVDWPYEWDYKKMSTPVIDDINYIVPRSLIDITEIVNNVFGSEKYTVNLDNIDVTAYKNLDKRGISFDYTNSSNTRMIVWMLDDTQTLTMRDVYNGNNIAKYTLLAPVHPSGEKLFIRPSGLIPYGKTSNGYKFMIESQPDTVIEGVDEYGNFEWLPTDINMQYDLRGILAYKDNLFITAVYTTDDVPEPTLIRYPNKGYYVDYQNPEPYTMPLSPDNSNPTDITVYEDGTLFINDYNVDGSGMYIYQYQPRYDYALKEPYTNNNARLLLRERYEDVTLTPSG